MHGIAPFNWESARVLLVSDVISSKMELKISRCGKWLACDQTWIDGRKYFDREEDLARREQVRKERAELIQVLLKEDEDDEKEDGEKKEKGGHHREPPAQYSCKGILEKGADHEDR